MKVEVVIMWIIMILIMWKSYLFIYLMCIHRTKKEVFSKDIINMWTIILKVLDVRITNTIVKLAER